MLEVVTVGAILLPCKHADPRSHVPIVRDVMYIIEEYYDRNTILRLRDHVRHVELGLGFRVGCVGIVVTSHLGHLLGSYIFPSVLYIF